MSRKQIWLAVIAVPSGLLLVFIMGLFAYMDATKTPLHPDPQQVRSVSRSDPSPEWAGAVEQSRQLVRASVAAQNLPGLSVAVGVDGDIVWAEGFGWELETLSLAGQPARMAGHGSKGDFIGATTYLMTFPERGLVVAVMANISFADTKSIALNIAQAFAEHRRSAASK